jgi:hypothetical protein
MYKEYCHRVYDEILVPLANQNEVVRERLGLVNRDDFVWWYGGMGHYFGIPCALGLTQNEYEDLAKSVDLSEVSRVYSGIVQGFIRDAQVLIKKDFLAIYDSVVTLDWVAECLGSMRVVTFNSFFASRGYPGYPGYKRLISGGGLEEFKNSLKSFIVPKSRAVWFLINNIDSYGVEELGIAAESRYNPGLVCRILQENSPALLYARAVVGGNAPVGVVPMFERGVRRIIEGLLYI